MKDDSNVFDLSNGKDRAARNRERGNCGRSRLNQEDQSSTLDTLNLRCLLDNQRKCWTGSWISLGFRGNGLGWRYKFGHLQYKDIT